MLYKLRAFIGTAIVVLFIIVFSDKKYEGISLWITDNAFNGTSEWRDPVLKLFLTSASLEAGLQGGEVPNWFFSWKRNRSICRHITVFY